MGSTLVAQNLLQLKGSMATLTYTYCACLEAISTKTCWSMILQWFKEPSASLKLVIFTCLVLNKKLPLSCSYNLQEMKSSVIKSALSEQLDFYKLILQLYILSVKLLRISIMFHVKKVHLARLNVAFYGTKIFF